eukprot:293049_1
MSHKPDNSAIQTNKFLVYVGYNSYGQVGMGHTECSMELKECKDDQNINIEKIIEGDCFNVYKDLNGEYWFTGNNNRGQCATNNFNKIVKLTKIKHNIKNIKYVICGVLAENILWITNDGLLYINGWNSNGQIGINSKEDAQTTPILIDYFHRNKLKVIYGASGFRYNIVICDNRQIYCCGYGDQGGNGLGGKSVNNWTQIEALKNIKIIDIKIGDYYSLFLSEKGNVYSCGINTSGQLGLGHFKHDPKLYPSIIKYFEENDIKINKIECGWYHSIALDSNNKIYSWGSNEFGQCGVKKDIKKIYVPQLIPFFKDSKLLINDIKCGTNHSVVITVNNEYFLFGSNKYHECGVNYKFGEPYLINNEFNLKFVNKKINDISLGYQTTILLVTNKENEDEKIEELTPQKNVEQQFYKFLERISMQKYFDKFKENECCVMESIALFDDEILQKEIGIVAKIARKTFLKHCKKMGMEMDQFKNQYNIPAVLYEKLAKYGIVTINILCNEVQNTDDLKKKFKIMDQMQCDIIWTVIQSVLNFS